jgi:hypothetical protein
MLLIINSLIIIREKCFIWGRILGKIWEKMWGRRILMSKRVARMLMGRFRKIMRRSRILIRNL